MSLRDFIRLVAMTVAVVILCFVVAVQCGARAHDAGGWQYGVDCCSTIDCAAIPEHLTPRITPTGYVLHDGTFVGKDSPARRDSLDMRWHRCDGKQGIGPWAKPFVRCLYIPGGGT